MRHFLKVFALISWIASAAEWKWVGFEIIGNRSVSREDVQKFTPIELGTTYAEDEAWKSWCENIQKTYDLAYAHCSTVLYSDFTAYFTVDLVEKGEEERIQFRAPPTGTFPAFPQEIQVLYDKFYERIWYLFSQGNPPTENSQAGYLDVSDAEAHDTVLELVKLVPAHREQILEILENDRDEAKRAQAANLMNWTVSDLSDSVIQSAALLDDPSSLVRNNISRFTNAFIAHVKSVEARKKLVDAYVTQLGRPSHGDRNKGIYNLLLLVQAFPEDLAYVRAKGQSAIRYLAETSVLSNVQGPAKELLQLIDHAGP